MCGISFIIDKQNKFDERPIQKMIETQAHRGPDAQHYFRRSLPDNTSIYFGATRLRISAHTPDADQPFFSADQSSVLIFNGEIYNFFDLKNELLKSGVSFTSNSDTEVLLYWVKEFGTSRLHELEGMFALVYCDLEKGFVIAARDRFGMKPLHYFENEKAMIFSSEARAIIASGIPKKELNENQIAHYFNYKYANPPETFYKDVYQLKPGHFLELKKYLLQKPIPYEYSEKNNSTLTVEDIKNDLVDSLYQQISSARGTGLLLSGGIDSSLLLALAYQEGLKLPAYSIYSGNKSKERQNASFLTKKLLVDQRVLEVDKSVLKDFDSYVSKLDQPISDSAGLLTWKVSDFAAKDVKVLLSGAGADELFAGYNRHKAFHYFLKNKRNALLFKKYGYPVLKRFIPNQAKLFFKGIEENEEQTMVNFIRSHLGYLQKHFTCEMLPMSNSNDALKNLLNTDLTTYLPNDVLAISDQMSMAVGLEMRMPFLTNSILHRVKGESGEFLMSKGPKWILKELLAEFVPTSYLKQPKVGFGLPLHDWLADDATSFLWSLFEKKNSVIFNFLEPGIFRQLLSQHKGRKGNHAQELWSILTLGYWLQNEFG